MSGPDFALVKRALQEVRGLPDDERGSWLQALRERDAAVHAEVVSLLAHEDAVLPEVDAWIVGSTWSGSDPEPSGEVGLALPRVVDDGPDRAYTLVHLLGQGGFGEVFLARMHHREIERLVAIKLLKTELVAEDGAVARLRDEARLLGTLRHPGIVTFLGLVQIDGRPGIVTEYVQGDDLAGCIHGPLPMTERAVLEVGSLVADALATAWDEVGVVHRDVKPQNIRIGVHGDVKLLDFGIARSDAVARSAHTGSQQLVGTLRYLAPERLQSQAPAVHASDVFSLGSVLFEALVHEPLFVDVDLLSLCQLVARPQVFRDEVAQRLERVQGQGTRELLQRMLALQPEERPTATEVVEQCDELADALPASQRLRRWCRRRSWPADPIVGASLARRRPGRSRLRVGLALLAAVGVGAALASWPRGAADPPRAAAPSSPPVAARIEPPAPTPPSAPEPAPAAPDPVPATLPAPEPVSGVAPAPAPTPAPLVSTPAPPEPLAEGTPDVAEVEAAVEPSPSPSPAPSGPTRPVQLVSVPPGAEVVDPGSGRILGTTPWGTELPLGNHGFLLRLGDRERRVEVRVGWLDASSRSTWYVADQRVSTTTVPR
ncbi:MAG: serine/threonine protein kinase [Myxococcales bacterium]|nr:serine/threonine protein kinase [Myxococcales bacterium]